MVTVVLISSGASSQYGDRYVVEVRVDSLSGSFTGGGSFTIGRSWKLRGGSGIVGALGAAVRFFGQQCRRQYQELKVSDIFDQLICGLWRLSHGSPKITGVSSARLVIKNRQYSR